ncbi:MAG: hypothetical protein MMC23_006658 [Stictis urceolatum]|nr:hypothetical protein [Stictis urceolata]
MEDNELSYEHRPLSVKIHDNQFAGLPRPELDAAWHELFESGWFVLQLSALDPERYSSLNRPPLTARVGLDNNIRVSKSDLDFHNVTSLPLADGSGYASQLGVFHELHCLKKIRQWIYRDYYLTDESSADLIEGEAHIHHCIEMLRESILCCGDTTLSSFEYIAGAPSHLTVVAKGERSCVNWKELRAWNDRRAIDAFEPGVLEGPR